jgi:hypothetical protein|tara:strand:- start:51 stop:491 length:441 start_codon:yes stop_codon:yes gene_type:complete
MLRQLLITCLLTLVGTLAWAEQKVDFSGHELHYIILNTTELPPKIAARYQIVRSGKRAFINLSILEKSADGFGTPVSAQIKARQRTLIGQIADIELQEIREGDSIYYIGSFEILNRDNLWFDIDLTVTDGPDFEFSFPQQVWQEAK